MIKNCALINQGYKLIFDLKIWLEKNGEDEMRSTHALTLDSTTNSGLSGVYGLYGTSEWWDNIEKGNIETYMVSGVIVDLSKGNVFVEDNTMITIESDNTEDEIYEGVVFTNENLKKEYSNLYSKGNKIVVFYILDELKDKDAFNPIIKDKVGFLPITNKVYIKGGN
ncbi:TPA: hypothetical protein JI054_11070 [Acinetobacter baumannii]|uniref:hypothetical protein n=3 Tax=Acinetobacter baumannii TaxID=470 RepID=UPI0002D01339|nr:hypothetical protein [Acinetobacter baumannii]AKQ29487.1 hypothetical protein ACX61_03505 [Acinetobacter baumannii]AMN02727.1 hypothetical protein AZE33_16430 [Acinetobacter baumannii]APO60302.1 hypothetical protein BBX32_18105 [Acinetobacter baumannii]ARG40210.1 hypothetical protein B7L35_15795 [Acinetobacter baumannii]AXX44828.1 hypothetical protein Aba10324_07610 [Acinetobacter baumannii]